MAHRRLLMALPNDIVLRGTPTHRMHRAIDYGYSFWVKQATIGSNHFNNLKYDDGQVRVWISRQTLADYDGDRRAYEQDRFTVEKSEEGVWKGYDFLGRRKY